MSRTPTLFLTTVLLLAGCNAPPATPPAAERPTATDYSTRSDRATRSERREERASRETREYKEDRGFDPNTNPTQPRRSQRPHTASDTQPGDFDFYLLNLSWSPEFCATHDDSPECSSHPGFVVHGLWPQNTNGTYPQNCGTAPGPTNPQSLTDTIPTTTLIAHEWQTHGTCTGLPADAYFAQIRTIFRQIHVPAAFTGQQPPAMLAPDAILAQFAAANPTFPAASFALSCGNNYLTAIEVCLTKDLHPEACNGVRSCRANAVKITPRAQ
jgi:ribonuclease T2